MERLAAWSEEERHDLYQNPRTGVCQPVPCHREIKQPLAKHILKMLKD